MMEKKRSVQIQKQLLCLGENNVRSLQQYAAQGTRTSNKPTNKQNVRAEISKPQRLGGCQFLLILMGI